MNDGWQDILGKPLDASRVKTRAAGGSKPALSYLETHDVIRTANAIFGFGAWGHTIEDLRVLEAVTVHGKDGKPGVHVGYVCIVKLTVEGCVPVSGIGYGDATEYRESAAVTAHELAAKEAESDALKRALKNYGDQFGLALYDKQAASAGHVVKTTPASTPNPATKEKTPEGVTGLSTEDLVKTHDRLAADWGKLEAGFTPADAVKKRVEKLNAAKAAGDPEPYRKWLTGQIGSYGVMIKEREAQASAAEAFPIPDAARAAA